MERRRLVAPDARLVYVSANLSRAQQTTLHSFGKNLRALSSTSAVSCNNFPQSRTSCRLFRGCTQIFGKLLLVFVLVFQDSLSRLLPAQRLFCASGHVDRPNGVLIAAAVLVYISPMFFTCSLNEFVCALMNSV